MDSLFQKYLKERKREDVIFSEGNGFICYKIEGDICLITECFVDENKRKVGLGSELVDRVQDIAISKGCKEIQCYVRLNTNCSELSMMASLSYGFKLSHSTDRDSILMYMEI